MRVYADDGAERIVTTLLNIILNTNTSRRYYNDIVVYNNVVDIMYECVCVIYILTRALQILKCS